jgi:hypothetical protein
MFQKHDFVWLITFKAPSWSKASQDRPTNLYIHRKLVNPLVQILSIHTTPKSGIVFGDISNGEHILRGFLFEIRDAQQRRKELKFKAAFHLDYEATGVFDKEMYFLPLAEVADLPYTRKERCFTGIYIQATAKDDGNEPTYTRKGSCYSMYGGGDGFTLDVPSWEKLLGLELSEGSGERIVIV